MKTIKELAGKQGVPKNCEWCEKNRPDGYLAAYREFVCDECYFDNFGMPD